jgi:hypothetical protein
VQKTFLTLGFIFWDLYTKISHFIHLKCFTTIVHFIIVELQHIIITGTELCFWFH